MVVLYVTQDAKIILETIAKELNVPYIQEKYYNISVDVVIDLIKQANDISKAERGIIVIEDIEDIINTPLEMRNLINFLRLSGIIIPQENKNEEEINEELVFCTENLTIVFLSKFDKVKEIRYKRLKQKIGF